MGNRKTQTFRSLPAEMQSLEKALTSFTETGDMGEDGGSMKRVFTSHGAKVADKTR